MQANLSTALFKFLEYLPAAGFTSTLAILLVGVFFITSADSGALVIDTLASGGADDTPRWQRVYWCLLLGVTATLLLLAGGSARCRPRRCWPRCPSASSCSCWRSASSGRRERTCPASPFQKKRHRWVSA
ncbi:BCCT family transporter [Novosphingobium panipatense]